MKSVVLSIVVVATLVAAGIGGTLADFSDYEVSEDNYFQAGSMDLVISDADGNEYNGYDNIPTLVNVGAGWPDCSKDRKWDIHNAGENEQEPPWLYIHFKNYECSWVDTKESATTPFAYMRIVPDSDPPALELCQEADEGAIGINEPQHVAIFGGVAGEDACGATVEVEGLGDQAITLLGDLVTVAYFRYSDEYPSSNPTPYASVPADEWHTIDLARFNTNGIAGVQIEELICKQIYLFQLTGCNMRWMNMGLEFANVDESNFLDSNDQPMDYFDAASKWNNWPTNAVQNSYIEWDMAFELFGQSTKPFAGD
jgi:predicted ribosomally synthesized peptide with SipW-like signal peptide